MLPSFLTYLLPYLLAHLTCAHVPHLLWGGQKSRTNGKIIFCQGKRRSRANSKIIFCVGGRKSVANEITNFVFVKENPEQHRDIEIVKNQVNI